MAKRIPIKNYVKCKQTKCPQSKDIRWLNGGKTEKKKKTNQQFHPHKEVLRYDQLIQNPFQIQIYINTHRVKVKIQTKDISCKGNQKESQNNNIYIRQNTI